MSEKSLALIGNGPARESPGEDGAVSARAVFDKETRRKALALAADASLWGLNAVLIAKSLRGGLPTGRGSPGGAAERRGFAPRRWARQRGWNVLERWWVED